MSDRELPTEPGSVIGWTSYYDGIRYGSAVLDWGDSDTDIAWWQGGFPDPLTPAAMSDRIGDHWQLLGKINLCPFIHPEHCPNHAEHVSRDPEEPE